MSNPNGHDAHTPSVNRYLQWGGLPAQVSILEDFAAARLADPDLACMFDKLDRLEQTNRTPAELIKVFNFTPYDLSRMNSPLLDGLWKMLTGRDPDERQIPAVFNDAGRNVWLPRLVAPKPYISTVQWLLDPLPTQAHHTVSVVGSPESSVASGSFTVQPVPVVESWYSAHQAFQIAATTGQDQMVQVLLPHVPVAKFPRSWTFALTRAATLGYQGVVDLLLTCDAIPKGSMKSVLFEAIRRGKTNISMQIAELCELFSQDPDGLSRAVSSAAQGGHLDMLKMLLDRSDSTVISPEANDKILSSAVLYAARFGYVPLLRFLLPICRSRNMFARDNRFRLANIICEGGLETLRLFVEYGPLDAWHPRITSYLVSSSCLGQRGKLPLLRYLFDSGLIPPAEMRFDTAAIMLVLQHNSWDTDLMLFVLEHMPLLSLPLPEQMLPLVACAGSQAVFDKLVEILRRSGNHADSVIEDARRIVATEGLNGFLKLPAVSTKLPFFHFACVNAANVPAMLFLRDIHPDSCHNWGTYFMYESTWHNPALVAAIFRQLHRPPAMDVLSHLAIAFRSGAIAAVKQLLEMYVLPASTHQTVESDGYLQASTISSCLLHWAAGEHWDLTSLFFQALDCMGVAIDPISYRASLKLPASNAAPSSDSIQTEARVTSTSPLPASLAVTDDHKVGSNLTVPNAMEPPGAFDYGNALVTLLEHDLSDSDSSCLSSVDQALICACRFGRVRSISLLLAYGADVQVEYNEPINVALQYRHAEVVRLLLARGANRAAVPAEELFELIGIVDDTTTL